VNRDTKKNFFFEIYLETKFEKEIVRKWLKYEIYKFENLSRSTTIKKMTIYERVKIKNKTKLTQNQTQYYLINVEDENYIIIKSKLFEMKNFSSVKLQRIDAQLNHQNAQLLKKLNLCRKRNVHSNIEEQLINADIEQMSWLSLNEILKSENENSDENESDDEDIENIIFQRTDLQRNLKSKIVSNTFSELWVQLWEKSNERQMMTRAYSEICTFL
jgi:hypothetical protein